ncbi:radical SAM protein [Cohnella hashimotonis]|uniref:Radical SAM protein n=1 Tax=Cohnella hashimotonis TaxID=2826895 RepID=A0ABT6TCH2_9BACL|nr:radical SAM protein [Cohnella hashimotonis]MDI4643527.1 radical SAM protein [Cohnella hashimotonis]
MVCTSFIIKVTSRCNLNCSYCYMFNKGDTTFQSKPKIMLRETAILALNKIYSYSMKHKISEIDVVLHGGEPLLSGKEWVSWFLEKSEELKPANLRVAYCIQTNGTLLDNEWISIFKSRSVNIGISLDGEREIHDQNRIDHNGNGSYEKVTKGIDLLLKSGYKKWGVLVVADPEISGEDVYNHLLDLGVKNMDFLWPSYNHDNPPKKSEKSLAEYYISVFKAWYSDKNVEINIRWFSNVIRLLLSGNSRLDCVGPVPLNQVVIETDGSIEPADMLRTCRDGLTRLSLNVLENNIDELIQTDLFQKCLQNQELLPLNCKSCSIYKVCGGGYMADRWKTETGFSNSSVHCADLYDVITYIRYQVVEDLNDSNIKYQIIQE